MKLTKLGLLAAQYLTDFEGEDGWWHGQHNDQTVYIVADEEHDRIRIMAPIGMMKSDNFEFVKTLLEANFDRALDAKYAIRTDAEKQLEVWSIAMHPLSTLMPTDLANFIEQVTRLVINTGKTFASGDIVFGVDEDGARELGSNFETSEEAEVDKTIAPPSRPKPEPTSFTTDEDRRSVERLLGDFGS